MSDVNVRCKVTCRSIEKTLTYGANPEPRYSARMSAVSDGSDENKKFWDYTPSGSIEFQTIKCDVFEVGKSYYVDFTPAAD